MIPKLFGIWYKNYDGTLGHWVKNPDGTVFVTENRNFALERTKALTPGTEWKIHELHAMKNVESGVTPEPVLPRLAATGSHNCLACKEGFA